MAKVSYKNRVWELLEHPAAGDRLSRLFDHSMIALILVSVTGVTLGTVPSVAADHPLALRVIEFGSVSIFTIEMFLRLWVADLGHKGATSTRLAYLRSSEGIVDLIAVVPFYLALFSPEWNPALAGVLLLRVFKLVRYSPALAMLGSVVVQERQALLGVVTIMLVLLLFSSNMIYLVEREAQPEAFGSIPASMWWGIATLTTVGFGDVTPITPVGKFFGSIVALLGVGMFALPAGILSSGFTKEMKQRRFLRTASLVAGVPLFERLNAPDIAQIARKLDPLVVQAGQVVVHQGEAAACMFFVANGNLQVEVDGYHKPLTTEFFGEIALLEGGTRSATIRSLSRCQLLMLRRKDFEELLAASPRIDKAVRTRARERIEADERRRRERGEDRGDPNG